MPQLRFRGSDGSARSVSITVAQPSQWPAGFGPEPVMPTGLTVVTSGGYQNADDREYRGLRGITPDISRKRVVFRDTHLEWFQVRAPSEDVWFVNCDAGPSPDTSRPTIASDFGPGPAAKRTVIFGGQFHGMHQFTTNDHTEGLLVASCDVLWIKGVHFYDNHVFNILLKSWGPVVRFVVVEDCVFGRVKDADGRDGFYTVMVFGDAANANPNPADVLLRNNLIAQPFSVHPAAVRATQSNNLPITTANLAAREQRLASWRARYGLPAQRITP